jgi:NADPH:quinone reductase-like Zn-dependent oxidoreductase
VSTSITTRVTEIVLPGPVEPDGLKIRARDLPAPGEGQVVLRMEATGVSFAEQQMRLGKYYDQPPFPFVPGYDVVGTVVATGPGVDPTLVQLARHAGIRVIGTASARHHGAVRGLGAIPVDYRDPDLYKQIRTLAPDGVDAVFDHVGGPGLKQSWRLLRRGGTLVNYGSASTKNERGNALLPMLALFSRLYAWHLMPNGRSATFYNFWAGRRRLATFQARLRKDLTEVLRLVADGTVVPQIAARIPLNRTADALRLAESRTVLGKVVIVSSPEDTP